MNLSSIRTAANATVLHLFAVLLLVVLARGAEGATVGSSGFNDSTYVSGLSNPTAMAWAPDGRLFVCTQGGALRVIKNGTLNSTPFASLSVDANGERGLLGIAFDPNFASNRWVYVQYTATSPTIHNRISRFTADSANPDVAAGGEFVLFDYDDLSGATNHNGGALHFGPDGKLYSGHGENANGDNAQTLGNCLGKILRLNSDGTIPGDNPFFSQASGKNRAIYALGLRNPFAFAFQAGTGLLYINDVGQSAWEEIDQGGAGRNYGWPNTEGNGTFAASIGTYSNPVHVYDHNGNCAITGGCFYNPGTTTFPSAYVGKYFFADYCGGWIKYIDPANPGAGSTSFASNVSSAVDLQVGPDGALYYLARGNGTVGRIQYAADTPPVITLQPGNATVTLGATASFSTSASGTPTLAYQWQRAPAGSSTFTVISGANSVDYTTPATLASDNGAQYRVVVSNGAGSATSNAATLTVTSNTPPTVTISTPTAGATYNGGSEISYSGSATDTQDGTEPASRFSWTVLFHHQSHTHPFLGPITNQTSGSFTIPVVGEPDSVQWYELVLTVTDAGGLATTSTRRIDPNTATITLATAPAGLQLTLDGQPLTSPQSITGVVGMTRSLGVVSPQTSGSVTYGFASWSDGGAATHTITTPSSATTYTATYQVTGSLAALISAAAVFSDGAGPWSGDANRTADKAYDGNTGTFYDCANADGYTGIDVGAGKTGTVTAIRYWARGSWSSRMIGGVFEGSNSQTSGYVTLATVASASDSAWTTLTVTGAAGYRYLRYRGPSNSFCNVAEIEFRGTVNTAGGTLDPLISASALFNDGAGPWGGNTNNAADKAYDGNTGTSYDCANADGYTGIDVGAGKTGTVTAIRYWARGTWRSRMIGGVFEGSNSQTSGYITLATVASASDSAWTTVTVTGAAGYRYLRYRGPANSYCNVAEIEFRGTVNSSSGGTLPSGWTAQDVGGVAVGGSTTQSNGTWTLSGSGADIWNNADGFRFASQRVTGDVQVTAQVTGLTNTNAWAKAGVTIRESLTAGSRHASTFATAGNGLAYQRRLDTDGVSSHSAGPNSAAPYWVRIERLGNVVISSTSANGTTWTEIRRETIAMSAAIYVGLAVTSHNNGALCTATFTNVEVVGVASAAN